MKNIKIVVGENIKNKRKEQSLSQDELAKSAEITRSYLGKVERGQVNITLDTLSILSKALGCSELDLMKNNE